MLKTIESPNMPAFRKNNDNDKIVGFSVGKNANRLFNQKIV